jgi:putative intracellular protease/amidase
MADANVVAGAACVADGKIITGTSAGTAVPFALALIEALRGAEAAKLIADQIVIR